MWGLRGGGSVNVAAINVIDLHIGDLPEQERAAGLQNHDFVQAIIVRRLKLD